MGGTSKITADEIRAIRRNLGLTQAEAGELLGGGPRAFTKYESGAIKPSASIINLLRLLEASPRMIETLGGPKMQPMSNPESGPFTVSGEHIAALTERALPELLRHLLTAEAERNGIPASAIHVSSRIHTPDGGEDGRIAWSGQPEHTRFLPGRLCQFQLKAGKIGPARAARDVVGANGEIKPMVGGAIRANGHYIMLCTHRYTQHARGP